MEQLGKIDDAQQVADIVELEENRVSTDPQSMNPDNDENRVNKNQPEQIKIDQTSSKEDGNQDTGEMKLLRASYSAALDMKKEFSFPIKNKEQAIKFIQQILNYYKILMPLPKTYVE
ncbi:7019_t:CDS:2, partial [Gigaspora rosea]